MVLAKEEHDTQWRSYGVVVLFFFVSSGRGKVGQFADAKGISRWDLILR